MILSVAFFSIISNYLVIFVKEEQYLRLEFLNLFNFGSFFYLYLKSRMKNSSPEKLNQLKTNIVS
jgi:hypothetical protein